MSTLERVLYSADQTGSTSATSQSVIYPFSEKGYISAVFYEPETAISQDDTNYQTLSVSANSTTIASLTTQATGGSAISADVPVSLTMAAGVRDKAEVEQGDALTVATTPTGTGPSYSGRFVVVVTLNRY